MNTTSALLIVTLILPASAASWLPDRDNTELGGYVEEVPIAVINDSLIWSNLFQARFNTGYYPLSMLSFVLQGRFVVLSGDQFSDLNPIVSGFDEDPGYLDLSKAWPSILYGNVDRAFLDFTTNEFTVRLGRQRINWGICYVWNPNDWFNASSFFDFSYEERRGTDALRIIYYPSVLSTVELALGAEKLIEDRTMAALYRFNKWEYDFQFQAGFFGNDLALGAGWAGQIADAGFRGEFSCFHPVFIRDSFSLTDSSGNAAFTISGDYTFSNSLYLHSEFLINGSGSDTAVFYSAIAQTLDPSEQITAKNLSPARYSLFGEVAYNFTPLTRGGVSFIASPFFETNDYLFFMGTSFQWSVFRNVDMTVLGQFFFETAFDNKYSLLAAEIRWSF